MQICPFDGCGISIPDNKFGCRKHWFQLNARQRATIWSAYRSYLAKRINLAKLRAVQQTVLAEWRKNQVASPWWGR